MITFFGVESNRAPTSKEMVRAGAAPKRRPPLEDAQRNSGGLAVICLTKTDFDVV